MKKLRGLYICLSLWVGPITTALAVEITYHCPAPGNIEVSNCENFGKDDKASTSCQWKADIVTSASQEYLANNQINNESTSDQLPKGPYQLMFVQFYPKTNRIRCGYLAESQFCSKEGICFRGGALEWGPVSGKCELKHAKVNNRGSTYCIGGSENCMIVCEDKEPQ